MTTVIAEATEQQNKNNNNWKMADRTHTHTTIKKQNKKVITKSLQFLILLYKNGIVELKIKNLGIISDIDIYNMIWYQKHNQSHGGRVWVEDDDTNNNNNNANGYDGAEKRGATLHSVSH